jgi:hypothetical protein
MWIMNSDGQEAHRIMDVGPKADLSMFAWEPTEQRFAYIVTRHQLNAKDDISIVDGNGLYVTAFLPSGTALLSVSLEDKVKFLFQQGSNWLCCPMPAPNGRSLAFSTGEIQRDVALLENF